MAETQQVNGVGCSLFILDRRFRPFFDDLCIDQIDDKYLGQLGDDGTRFQHRFPCLVGNAQVGAVPEFRPRTGRDGNQAGAVLPGQTGGLDDFFRGAGMADGDDDVTGMDEGHVQHDEMAVVQSQGIDADTLEFVGRIVGDETGISQADEIHAVPAGQQADCLGDDLFIEVFHGLAERIYADGHELFGRRHDGLVGGDIVADDGLLLAAPRQFFGQAELEMLQAAKAHFAHETGDGRFADAALSGQAGDGGRAKLVAVEADVFHEGTV